MTTPTVPAELEVEELQATTTRRIGKRRLTVRRFMRNKPALGGVVLLLLLVLFALAGPHLTHWKYTDNDFLSLSQGPSASHWFGTDEAGGDMFALTARGLQKSLLIGVMASLGTTIVASVVGASVAYFVGWREKLGMWIIDTLMVVPSFLILAMLVANSTGSNSWLAIVGAFILFGWIGYARVLRSLCMSLREREFVLAAKYMGVSSFTIIRRHLIPNLGSVLIIHTVLGVVAAVAAETGLSFLGIGVKPPDTSLGVLMRNGAGSMLTAPWLLIIPTLFLIALTFSMTLIGDGLRDALDPNSASGGAA
jgi:peptide/nickel transport system permease protein